MHEDHNSLTAHLIGQKVREGAKPWDIGPVKVLLHSNINGDKILVVPRNLPIFEYKIDPYDAVQLTPVEFAVKISEAAFNFYRYRPALPVDDHIVLGEN